MQKSVHGVACLLQIPEVGWLAPVMGPHGLVAMLTGVSDTAVRPLLAKQFPGVVWGQSGELGQVETELREYFAGRRRAFSLACDLTGLTPFTRLVLEALRQIPYGETVSYGELARRVGRPRAARAVGAVMAHNRWPIILPCHRVIGVGGDLVGYSGGRGLESKRWLLDWERQHATRIACEIE